MIELWWRRLPLTRTRTCSGPSPRRSAGSMWSVPSAMLRWLALNDGATVFRIWLSSVSLDSKIASLVITSTGTGVSSRLRGVRDPMIVITSPSCSSVDAGEVAGGEVAGGEVAGGVSGGAVGGGAGG